MLDSPRFATMGRWRRTEVVKVNLAIDAGSLCYTSCCLTCAGGTVLSLLLLLLLLLLSLLLMLLLVKFVISSFFADDYCSSAHLSIALHVAAPSRITLSRSTEMPGLHHAAEPPAAAAAAGQQRANHSCSDYSSALESGGGLRDS